jgi:two-component system response regulator NreC
VAVVDDHPAIRIALKGTLAKAGHLVVAEAGSLAEAAGLLQGPPCEVLVVDLMLGDGETYGFLEEFRRLQPEVKILIFSMHGSAHVVQNTLAMGVHGYFHKADSLDLLEGGLHRMIAGETFLTPTAKRSLDAGEPPDRSWERQDEKTLTPREREILRYLGQSYTRQEIATEMGISPRTVDTMTTRLKQKLSLPNTRALVRFAFRHLCISVFSR